MIKQFKGVSAYALLSPGFPIRRFLKCYVKDLKYPGTAILFNRFGRKYSHIKSFCRHFSQKHCLEAHFASGPARRKRSFDVFDLYQNLSVSEYNKAIISGTLPGIEKEIHKFALNLEKNITDKTKLLICPELEDNLSDHAFCVMLNLFKAEFMRWSPQPTFVRSPCMGGSSLYGCYKEVHGRSTSPANVYNPDGVSVDFSDKEFYFDTMSVATLMKYMKAQSGAKLRLVWCAWMQGADHATSFNYKKPTERKFVVTDDAILHLNTVLGAIE